MAKKLSAKQIKYFGTPRQKAALKAKRKAAAKTSHRPRTKKKKNTAMGYRGSGGKPKGWSATSKAKLKKKRNGALSGAMPFFRRSKKKLSAHGKPKRKKNPGEIIAFLTGNPAQRRKKAMAKSKKKKYSAASKRAGRPKKKVMSRARRKKNPSIGRPMDWLKGGVGVIGGGVGTRLLPQLAGTSNTGPMGYAMNAGAALLLAWGTHAVTKDTVLTAAVAAGGFAALILRIVGDYTPYGSQLALSGVGDYMVSNWISPQRIAHPNSANWELGGTVPGGITTYGGVHSGADVMTRGNSF